MNRNAVVPPAPPPSAANVAPDPAFVNSSPAMMHAQILDIVALGPAAIAASVPHTDGEALSRSQSSDDGAMSEQSAPKWLNAIGGASFVPETNNDLLVDAQAAVAAASAMPGVSYGTPESGPRPPPKISPSLRAYLVAGQFRLPSRSLSIDESSPRDITAVGLWGGAQAVRIMSPALLALRDAEYARRSPTSRLLLSDPERWRIQSPPVLRAKLDAAVSSLKNGSRALLGAVGRETETEIHVMLRAFEAVDRGVPAWTNIARLQDVLLDYTTPAITVEIEATYGDATMLVFEDVDTDVSPCRCAASKDALEVRLRRVARDVSAGLRVLHDELRVVHRDIKPENVLLAADGTAKLADFGVAAVLGAGQDAATDQQGTTVFMSPERLRGEAHGPASDVWALGVTLLQLALRGRHPFADCGGCGTARLRQLGAVLHHTRSLEECERATTAAVEKALAEAGLSAGFGAFVRSCLAADAGARLPASALLLHPWLAPRQACACP